MSDGSAGDANASAGTSVNEERTGSVVFGTEAEIRGNVAFADGSGTELPAKMYRVASGGATAAHAHTDSQNETTTADRTRGLGRCTPSGSGPCPLTPANCNEMPDVLAVG